MSELQLASQYKIDKVAIDGEDVMGIYQTISVFEDMFNPLIFGSIVLLDSDNGNFMEQYEIEGNESIELEFTNSLDESFTFKGVLNGMRNKVVKEQKNIYTFDFSSVQLRNNEKVFVNKRFNAAPKEIISEMILKLDANEDMSEGVGFPMNFTGARRRPLDVIQTVLKNGVANDGTPNASSGEKRDGTTSGTSGFLCWQTLDGYRFGSVDAVLRGDVGTDQGQFDYKLQNNALSMEESMDSIVSYEFSQIGDIQAKLRSGAFKTVNISFDMDKGYYTEYKYEDDHNLTEKQKAIVEDFPTRYLWKPYANEVYENTCTKAQENYWDQSRLSTQQNIVRQNTFNDQNGSFTLNPRYEIRPGDFIEVKIPKLQMNNADGYNDKHSGRYIISKVGNHFFADGRSFTKVGTIRSTIQTSDSESRNT